MKSPLRRAVVVTAIAVAVLAAGLVFHFRRPAGLARLRRLSAPVRPLEARLWRFRYAASPLMRDGAGRPEAQAGFYDAAAEESETTRDPHARAVALLITGDAPAAERILTAEAKVHPGDPSLWTDLSAVRQALAQRAGDKHAALLALDASDRALALDARSPEARFNRALILENLGLSHEAASVWRSVAALDAGTPWSSEERSHLRNLSGITAAQRWKEDQPRLEACVAQGDFPCATRLVRQYPQEARLFGEGVYLSAWGDALQAGKFSAAATQLRIARTIGNALVVVNGETLLRDAVKSIDDARDDPLRQKTLANAHVTYKAARFAYRDRNISVASALFKTAAVRFQAARSPMELVCRYYQTSVMADQGEGATAAIEASNLIAALPQGYRALAAQLWWNEGRFARQDGRPDEAVTSYERARDLFDQLGESDDAVTMRGALASTFSLLGRERDAWQIRSEVFAAAGRSGNANLTQIALTEAIETEGEARHWNEARTLANVAIGAPAPNPRARITALITKTYASLSTGDGGFADTFAATQAAIARLPDDGHRAEALDELKFIDAVARLHSDPRGATSRLGENIAFAESHSRRVDLPAAYAARAEARRTLGDAAGAVSDLESAAGIIEERRAAIRPFELRDSFFGTAKGIFEQLVTLLLERGEVEQAFDAAERSRARVFLDHFSEGGRSDRLSQPLQAEAIRQALPPNTVLLHYVSLPARLAIFVMTRDALSVRQAAVSGPALEQEIAALVDATRTNGKNLRALRQKEFQRFVEPVITAVAGAQQLVIVADDTTSALPFASLLDAAGGRPLLARVPSMVAPSATWFVRGIAALDATLPQRIVAVGDPAFDTTSFPQFDRLPSARLEAVEIAREYPNAVVLTDRDATVPRVLSSIADADVIHFGSHAVVDDRDPLLGALLLTPGPGESGMLYVRRIAAVSLPRHPVVVLAGCETGRKTEGSGELRSLASAFLFAGSRAVVATLWPVEDRAAREFSRRLHRQLAKGISPAVAVQRVQSELMRDPDPQLSAPGSWSAFELFGN